MCGRALLHRILQGVGPGIGGAVLSTFNPWLQLLVQLAHGVCQGFIVTGLWVGTRCVCGSEKEG